MRGAEVGVAVIRRMRMSTTTSFISQSSVDAAAEVFALELHANWFDQLFSAYYICASLLTTITGG